MRRTATINEFVRARVSHALSVHHALMPDIEIVDADSATGIWVVYDWVDDPKHRRAFEGYGNPSSAPPSAPRNGDADVVGQHFQTAQYMTPFSSPLLRATGVSTPTFAAPLPG